MAYDTRIGFKRHLRTEVAEGGAAYLLGADMVTALAGPSAAELARLLDGTRSLAGILKDASTGLTTEQIAGGVRQLAEAGLLTIYSDSDSAVAPEVLAYWDAAGLDGSQAVQLLDGSRVVLTSLSPQDTGAITEAMRGAGCRSTRPGRQDGGLAVVLCDDYLDPGLAAIDEAHRSQGTPWLLAKPSGTEVWIGPVFTPDGGPCWRCVADRIALHRRPQARLNATPPRVAVPPTTAMAAHLVALEAAKWTAGVRYEGQQRIWIHDSLTLTSRHHEVTRRPQCPSCGDPGLMRAQASRPVELSARRKVSCASGGHRSAAPEDTLQRYGHLISPVTGIIDEIVPDDRGPRFFNSYRSGPNLALSSRSMEGLRAVLREHSGGKGVTALESKVGALCEAAERFSASFQGDEHRISGSYLQLREQAIHPEACQLYDPRQYETRAEWNRVHGAMLSIPEPIDETATLDWTPLWSLSREEHRLLPTSMLFFGAPGPLLSDSNGNAAGSSLEDAVLQGMFEVIERDATAIWWDNRLRVPGFDLDDLADPWIDEYRQVHADLGREVWVLDITADLPVPTMAAFSRSTRGPELIMFGFGTHLDPAVALRRALTELNQAMPWAIEEQPDSGDPDLENWRRVGTVAGHPYLVPDPAVPMRRLADHPFTHETDLAADVRHVQGMLESAGLEVLVLDQTRPDLGLPTVKVVVPGLRPVWARRAPGRLFDVPVRLGLLPEPTPYDNLNPVPLFH